MYAYASASMRECEYACVRVRARARVCVRLCVSDGEQKGEPGSVMYIGGSSEESAWRLDENGTDGLIGRVQCDFLRACPDQC